MGHGDRAIAEAIDWLQHCLVHTLHNNTQKLKMCSLGSAIHNWLNFRCCTSSGIIQSISLSSVYHQMFACSPAVCIWKYGTAVERQNALQLTSCDFFVLEIIPVPFKNSNNIVLSIEFYDQIYYVIIFQLRWFSV